MKNVLIIGGSRGIGAETVRQFAAAGDRVVFTFLRSESAADALRQETGAAPVRCDVSHSGSVKIAIDKAVIKAFEEPLYQSVTRILDQRQVTDG